MPTPFWPQVSVTETRRDPLKRLLGLQTPTERGLLLMVIEQLMNYVFDTVKKALKITGDVSLSGRTPTIVTLQNAATVAGVGTPFTVGGNSTLTFEVAFSGTATGTVVIQGAEMSGTFYNLGTVINLNTNTVVSQITASGLYQVDITGLDKVQANITSITPGTGNINVNGKAVA